MTTSAPAIGHVSGGAEDVLFFPKGSRIRFETPDRALGFSTGQRSFVP
jgi:ethanolamine utilization protein EutQ